MESSSQSRKTRKPVAQRADRPHVDAAAEGGDHATCARPLRRTDPPATGEPASAADGRRVLRALRVDLGGHVGCIDQLCSELLDDELCQQLAEEAGRHDDDFIATLEDVRQFCARATALLGERFTSTGPEGPSPGSDDFHDLKNCINGIQCGSAVLLEQGDQRFLSFEESIRDVQAHAEACLAAVNAARAKLRGIELAGGNGSVAAAAAPLPAAIEPEPESAPVATPDYMVPAVEPAHILVVDDDRTSRDYLARELQRHRHQVTTLEDGRQAIELLQRTRYTAGEPAIDLVLLDLRMRDVDGLTVLAEMKKDYGLRSVPVVMVSAYDEIDTVVRCISYGADDYLTKPYEPRILQARVNSCLAKAELRRQERLLSEQVRAAKLRADNLLYDIFPYTVAEELITSGAVKPRGCDNVAVLFCDIVGFTAYCNDRSPAEIVASLHELFTAYDEAIRETRVEKIKTIGDCMMVTAGLAQRFENPVLSCIRCGEQMIQSANACSTHWSVRVGIHVGPVVAGMAGNRQYAFDVWGDTVNTAARVEAIAETNTIAVSEPAWAQVFEQCKGQSMGVKPLKGRKSMEVFRFEGFR